jgi:CheY-like chemotaxis protein
MHDYAARNSGGSMSVQTDSLSPESHRKILVADDNRDSADSLAMLLQLGGHEVFVAYDGEDAIARAETCRPQVVLLDIGMPRLDGYAVAARLRGEPWGREMRLIALTGWGQEDDKARARNAGFDEHLTKPVDPDELERLLAG